MLETHTALGERRAEPCVCRCRLNTCGPMSCIAQLMTRFCVCASNESLEEKKRTETKDGGEGGLGWGLLPTVVCSLISACGASQGRRGSGSQCYMCAHTDVGWEVKRAVPVRGPHACVLLTNLQTEAGGARVKGQAL